jgi:predicted cupin superfamily sugar epimerase
LDRFDREAPMSNATSDDLTADQLRTLLQLEPNATCGFVRLTYVSKQSIAPGGLPAPFADGRPLGSALYFMMTPTAPVRLHRIRNDQLYHYYLGDPIELFLLHADGKSERIIVGPDLRAGQRVQQLIPGNTFHTAAAGAGSWAQAPNGRAWRRRTSKSAISTSRPRDIRPLPLSSARSRRRCRRSFRRMGRAQRNPSWAPKQTKGDGFRFTQPILRPYGPHKKSCGSVDLKLRA